MRIVTRAVALGVLLAGLHCSGTALAQTLERGNGPEPSTLDPHRCPEVACANILRDLFEGLVAVDGAGRLVPGLAQRWTVSGDGRTWTFHLRPDARWSNGEALDAPQVLASLRRAFAPATAAPFAGHLDAIENATAVQRGQQPPENLGIAAPDPATLVFTLRRSADLPRLLTLPVAYPVYLPGLAEHGARRVTGLEAVPLAAALGRRLAERYGLPFVDADREIEQRTAAYIRTSWTNQAPTVQAADVAHIRQFVANKSPHIQPQGASHD